VEGIDVRIGLPVTATATLEEIIEQARSMEADGFSSMWFGNSILGDPLVGMAIVGRETTTLELGTSVLQTYPCHPLLQANRAASVANAIGRGFALGIGPSHAELVSGMYGLAYDHPGRNTEEYTQILARLLRGEPVDFDGEDWRTHAPAIAIEHPVPLLLSAMSPRLLRIAGELADGTITFLAQAKALETLIVPKITAAAAGAGRPAPRVIVGLPVCVTDDAEAARAAYAPRAAILDPLPNYQRIVAAAGYERAVDVAIIGDERAVKTQIRALFEAGATDLWPGPITVGDDPEASRRRTLDVLRDLLA
jgi:F420-dependent oxidoreductase-like protein